jgi:hypothetical protein
MAIREPVASNALACAPCPPLASHENARLHDGVASGCYQSDDRMELFAFGFGFTALRLVDIYADEFERISGTVRHAEKRS